MNTILYGECVRSGQSMAVRISGLADGGCALETDKTASPVEGDCALWIGAIGPFPATVERRDAGRHALRFKEPLDHKIVSHFTGE